MAISVILSPTNLNMIRCIMKTKFNVFAFPTFSKYVNESFDIIVQNNQTIIVIDKVLNRFYKDLKTAYSTITNFKETT